MDIKVVLATLSAQIRFSSKGLQWLAKAGEHQLWIGKDEGRHFLTQFHNTWRTALIESCEPFIRDYLRSMDCPLEGQSLIHFARAFRGAGRLEATIVVTDEVARILAADRGRTSELAAGLFLMQERLAGNASVLINRRVCEQLTVPSSEQHLGSPPVDSLEVELLINKPPG